MALVVAAVLFTFANVSEWMNEDETLPTITADSDTIDVPCAYTTDQLLAGVTASDAKDGDLTGQILVGNFTRFIDPGVCDLNYVVFDSSEHMATLTRRVHFTDYHSPRFALAEPLVFAESTTNNTEVRDLFSASDVLDGDLTDWITYVETNAAYNNPGDYTITMEVRNSFGDTVRYAFPIHIYERNTQDFTISLTDALVYVQQGGDFDPLEYIESVEDLSGNEYSPSLLRVTSTVDTGTPGIYEVHYEIGNAVASSAEEESEEDTTEEDTTDEETDSEDLLTSIEGEDQYGQIWLTVIVQEVPA